MSSQLRNRKRMEENQALQSDNDAQTNKKKGLSPIAAAIGNVWFFGLSIGVCIVTELYYEFIIAFGIHYLVFFCYALPFQSEKFYDFTGMIAFISVDIFSFFYRKQSFKNTRNVILFFCVLFWTLRLGLFLFWRILQHGGIDSRFNKFKGRFFNFLMLWTMSGQWVFFCMIPVFIVNKNGYDDNLYATDIVGYTLFIIGWIIEIVSDVQKTMFKADVKNKGKFINTGLWKLSRHPNYFGDIMLWLGIAIVCVSVVEKGTDWLLFVSPFWTFCLLTFMSGIPASEAAFKSKYKDVEGFKEYLDNTPILIPFCFCWK